jgi:hypothetical protein
MAFRLKTSSSTSIIFLHLQCGPVRIWKGFTVILGGLMIFSAQELEIWVRLAQGLVSREGLGVAWVKIFLMLERLRSSLKLGSRFWEGKGEWEWEEWQNEGVELFGFLGKNITLFSWT